MCECAQWFEWQVMNFVFGGLLRRNRFPKLNVFVFERCVGIRLAEDIFRLINRLLVPGHERGRGRWRWSIQHVTRSLGPRMSGPRCVAARARPAAAAAAVAAAVAAADLPTSPVPAPLSARAPGCWKQPPAPELTKRRRSPSPSPSSNFAEWLLRRAIALMVIGLVLVSTAVMILAVDPYTKIFNSKVQLNDGGETYELWRKPPVDLFLKVWLFNVTNADEFLSGQDEKLKVQEVGPYIYRELMEHGDVRFNDNGTLTTAPKHPLVWEPEINTHKEDDILVLPNIALLSISNVMRDTNYFTRLGLNLLVKQTDSQPLVKMTAREFMFGYETPLTTLGNKVLPSWIFFDKIGLIDRMYDFTGDTMVVNTGSEEVSRSGLIERYRGLPYIPEWPENCSMVEGASDASKFNSLIKEDDQLIMYRKSLCRAMPMKRTGETKIGGLDGYIYTWKDGILDNGKYDPHNKCYCRHDNCLPEGIIDVEECYYGFPIALSYPHFYLADPAVRNMTDGSEPDPARHETVFIIEPASGLPLHTAVRMQINMALGDLSKMHRVGRFSNLILPMLWLEISCEKLPDHLQNLFFFYLKVAPVLLQVILYGSLIGGPIMLIASIIRVYWSSWFSNGEADPDQEFSRKHMNVIHSDRRASLKAKEMDVYFTSLLMAPTIDEEHGGAVKEDETV